MATKRKAAKKAKSVKKNTATKGSRRRAVSVATSARGTVKQRVAAMAQASLAVCESDKNLQAMLKVLRNKDEPVQVRLAAMDSLATAAFSVIAFEPCRKDYIATLREVAQDPNADIRESALGLLAGQKDGFAQKKLLEGLQNPDMALLPPEKALQLLSYDVHAEAYSLARDIVSKPPNEDARREALRLLAADASSASLFEKLLRDKDELREIRQIAASALHALKPQKLQELAREILLDKSDYDDIKATSLTALTEFGDDETIGKDKALMKSVDRLSVGKAPSKYKQSARRFLSKYGR
jgi:HEAT repeat protein